MTSHIFSHTHTHKEEVVTTEETIYFSLPINLELPTDHFSFDGDLQYSGVVFTPLPAPFQMEQEYSVKKAVLSMCQNKPTPESLKTIKD